MKVAVVGPVAPFHSGIARHTTALLGALAARADLDARAWSFSRQYPQALFPGQSQTNCDARSPVGVDTRYSIDSINPLSWRYTLRDILAFAPDLVVVPAWTFFVAPALGWISRELRKAGSTVVMVVHNAHDHEAARWKNRILQWQLQQASRFVTHNQPLADTLGQCVPGRASAICPHPLYDDYPEAQGTLPRRAALELLFFGLVRPYKGLDTLLHALARCEGQDVRLSVVGEFWSGREETENLISTLRLADKVELVPHYVADREAAEYFARSDVVIAPYHATSASGVLALAQWYARPVVASDIPGLRDAIEHERTGWLFPARDVAALADLLQSRVTRERAHAMRANLAVSRDASSWHRLADVVLAGSDAGAFGKHAQRQRP